MRRLSSILFAIIFATILPAFAQPTGQFSVQNPSINGNQLEFDLVMTRTDAGSWWLDGVTVDLNFDQTKFISTSATLVPGSSSLPGSYAVSVNLTSAPRRIRMNVLGPFPASSSNTVQVSPAGTTLGRVRVQTINNFSGTAGISFGNLIESGYYTSSFNQSNPLNVLTTAVNPIALGPSYEARVKNQQLLGGQYTFDLYVKRTGASNFLLGPTDFVFTANNSVFNTPTFTTVQQGLAGYNYTATFVSNKYKVTVSPANLASPTAMSNTGDGTYIGTFQIATPNGSASLLPVNTINLAWSFASPQFTDVYAFVNSQYVSSTYDNGSLSSANQHLVDAPVESVVVTAPVSGTQYCPNAPVTITWNSLNLPTVNIALMQGTNVVSTIASNVNAQLGTFTWNANVSSGTYSIRVNGGSTSSSVFNIFVSAPFVFSGLTQSTNSVCSGNPVNFTATAVGTNVGYQWYYGTTAIVGATNATLTIPSSSISNAGSYSVMVSGNCTTPTLYGPLTLAVRTAPQITVQPSASTVTVGNTVNINVSAEQRTYTSPTAFTASSTGLSYQWQRAENGSSTFTNLSGQTASVLSFVAGPSDNGASFQVIVSGGACAPTSVTSTVAAVTVFNNNVNLNVTAYIQGQFGVISSVLRHRRTPIAVELRSGDSPATSSSVQIATAMMSTAGTAQVSFVNVTAGNYWIILRHGGSLSVASATPVALTPGVPASFDFTNPNNVFTRPGANATPLRLQTINGVDYYLVRSGDLDGSGIINVTDFGILQPNLNVNNPSGAPEAGF